MNSSTLDVIQFETIGTLGGLLRERARRTPDTVAYRYFDPGAHEWLDITWQETANRVAQIQAALAGDGLQPGDRVAVMLRNCPQWVQFEQAALGLGLVVVPLYTNDRVDNISYVLQDAGVKALLVEGQQDLDTMSGIASQIGGLSRLVTLNKCDNTAGYSRLMQFDDWVDNSVQTYENRQPELQTYRADRDDLATIVYTSGTTGRPKGVMLSHRNILYNAHAAVQRVPVYREDLFLSFLPLSHMLERTVGYYIPMMCGSTMAFARSVQELAEDLLTIKPTILISVPRIYERVYGKISTQLENKSDFARNLFHKAVELGWQRFQHPNNTYLMWPLMRALVANKIMAKLGGRLRLAICGGAPLSNEVAKTFVGLGLNLIQGYGLTETSPIISANRVDNNDPASVGEPLEGIEVQVTDNDELITRSQCNMLGYWNNKEATDAIFDADGWLHTGDKARIDNNRIYITGRLKEIIVLSNGKKAPPADIEMAVSMDNLFDQVMVIGDNCPYLSALVVLNQDLWPEFAKSLDVEANEQSLQSDTVANAVLERINNHMREFPGYMQIRRVTLSLDPWTIDNGLITPTMKLKRGEIEHRFQAIIDSMYEGHEPV
ncbi:MAG: long-chain fatty acid--CoA ligase [Gammaproteobacteria bacterium]|jgi:long-chain acyl-CoA synthetase